MEESGKSIDPTGGLRLQSLLRGLRSRKPSVREFALQEASRLDAPQKSQFDAMVERSFKEEAGRRRFWRFMAFYGSPLVAGVLASLLRHLIPEFHIGSARFGGADVGEIMSFFGWFALWTLFDRAAKRAFILPEDGRKLWQQRRKEENAETGVLDTPSEAHEPSTAVQAFTQELTDVLTPVREAAQQKAALLSVDDLLSAARLLMQQYEQQLDAESRKRNRLSNTAFWLFVTGVFTNFWPLMLGVLGFALYALYYRNEAVRRPLEALPVVLEDLARRGVPVSLDQITPHLDPILTDRMKRQCPALDRFLPGRMPSSDHSERRDDLYLGIGYSSDTGVSIRTAIPSIETRDALRELSADVLLAPFDDVEETLIALKKLEETGDESVLPLIQRLAAQPFRFLSVRAPLRAVKEYRQDAQRIREAARACLNVLQARSDVQQRTLLRPSEASTAAALLRPVETTSNDPHPQELLRPSASEPQTTEAVALVEPHVYVSVEETAEVKAQVNHS